MEDFLGHLAMALRRWALKRTEVAQMKSKACVSKALPNPPNSYQARNLQRMPEPSPSPSLFSEASWAYLRDKLLRPFISESGVQRPVWVRLQLHLNFPQTSWV